MISSIAMILSLAVCFIAAVLNLAVDSPFRRKTMRVFLILAMLIGAFFYGYGYGWCMGWGVTSLIRALLALCRMLGGINDLASVQAAPLFRSPIALAIFWLGHFLAFYVMASTAIATLGARLLRHIRVTLLRRGPLLLIYGVNAHSVAYGRRMAKEKRRSAVYVDQDYNPTLEEAVQAFGAIVEKDADALTASSRFLRQINMKPGSRRLELAALHADGQSNLAYARALLNTMTEAGIRPEQTSLLAAGIGDEVAALQALGGDGYGSVYAFDDYELLARLMLRAHPPCGLISFDAAGRATEDFSAVILGFGRMGRAVLTQLILNGQFCGSHFRADVFDSRAQNGFLHGHPLMNAYDIRFHSADGTADAFYDFLEKRKGQISMIVLCTGSKEKNHEIAEDLAAWLPWDAKPPVLLHATKEGYYWLDESRREVQNAHFLDDDGLDLEALDAMAMQINHIYCKETGSRKSARQEWQACSYFNRRSSRACADFYPAVLRASGRTARQVLDGDWPPDAETLENLARTEHLRWCAFQYVSGYAPMPQAVWDQRAQRYRQGAPADFRVSKDERQRLQACLIPWEELDGLSQRENAVTGGQIDYKQMDRNNVLLLSRVLQMQKETVEENARG